VKGPAQYSEGAHVQVLLPCPTEELPLDNIGLPAVVGSLGRSNPIVIRASGDRRP
jgi:hypothetical protein